MPTTVSLLDSRAYHIICYSTFVGTTFFQSFIAGPVAYNTLPRALFGRLQEATFPVFFSLQTALSAVLILTYPGDRPLGVTQTSSRANSGFYGVFDRSNTWSVAVPMLLMLATSAVNLAVLGPATTKTMKQRHHQGLSSPGDHSVR